MLLASYCHPARTHAARRRRLERRQAEGYTLLGLEQTAESVRLPDYTFPSKAVLVLGRVKEGLPQEVRRLPSARAFRPGRGSKLPAALRTGRQTGNQVQAAWQV
jgi:hypothetical protein